jgi:septal ring factor EnvC (AmiA/AmiB activator)
MATASRIGELRKSRQQLEREVAALRAQVGQLEKGRDAAKLAAVQQALEVKEEELASVQDELEGAEDERQSQSEATDELEQLVDAFGSTIARVPELAPVLEAMKLTVGALATARRLGRQHEALPEPPQVVAALTQALGVLATWVSTPATHVRLTEGLSGVVIGNRRERFDRVKVQHRGRSGTATIDVQFDEQP